MKMYEKLQLAALCDKIKDEKLPLKTAYQLALLQRELAKDIEFYQNRFNEIVEEFAQKDEEGKYIYTEDGSSISIIPGREVECNTAVSELQNLVVEVPDVRLKIEALESLNLTMSEMSTLLPLIEE